MAKIARTPYNGSRWVTKRVSTSTVLNQKLTGQCIFVNANGNINLDINFVNSGSYFKIILREDTSGNITLTFPSVEGVIVSDDGSSIALTNVGDSGQTTLVIPTTASAGSYLDLISDGTKWYITGMIHGVQPTQS